MWKYNFDDQNKILSAILMFNEFGFNFIKGITVIFDFQVIAKVMFCLHIYI